MNPDDPGSQGYSPRVDPLQALDEDMTELAMTAREQATWLAERPEWTHTDIGRRFKALIDAATKLVSPR
jgi:hypothetical protein